MDTQYVRVPTGRGRTRAFIEVEVPSDKVLVAAAIELRALSEGRVPTAGRFGTCVGCYIPSGHYDTQTVCPFTLHRGPRTSGGILPAFCSFITNGGAVFADTQYEDEPPPIHYYCKPVPKTSPGLFEQHTGMLEEGIPQSLLVTAFERNPEARRLCIQIHGSACLACGMDFGSTYGEEAASFIHVHHVEPISAHRQSYIVDPRKDLVPLCPNCHGVAHLRNPPYSVDDIRAMLARQQPPRRGAGL